MRSWADTIAPPAAKQAGTERHFNHIAHGSLVQWIESELARSKVSDSRRATLEELRQKGLEGKLSRSETQKLRRKENTVESGLKKVISQLRLIRRRSAQLANMPPEALAHLDSAIAILANDDALKVARLAPMTPQGEKWRGFLTA